MDDLIAFVAARLDEDEAAARAAVNFSYGVPDWCDDGDPDGVHIARHDPARVLREVEASRKLLVRYERLLEEQERNKAALAELSAAIDREERTGVWDSHGFPDTRRRAIAREADYLNAMIPVLRELIEAKAAVWRDHPDCEG